MSRWAIVIVLVGCGSSSGRQVKKAELDKIVLGKTTWAEAEKMLGAPINIMDSYNDTAAGYYAPQCGAEKANIRVAQYTFAETNAGGGGQHESTELLIDQGGVVCFIKRSGGAF